MSVSYRWSRNCTIRYFYFITLYPFYSKGSTGYQLIKGFSDLNKLSTTVLLKCSFYAGFGLEYQLSTNICQNEILSDDRIRNLAPSGLTLTFIGSTYTEYVMYWFIQMLPTIEL